MDYSHFNPRTREGCDAIEARVLSWLAGISIHAPVKGATRRSHRTRRHRLHFNPRTREGCDYAVYYAGRCIFPISIHAPVKGATPAVGLEDTYTAISIHAPVKGATTTCRNTAFPARYFNPRTREGCDFSKTAAVMGQVINFNPRTREGCDMRVLYSSAEFHGISIHAPVKGATTDSSIPLSMSVLFQSTHP